MKSITTDELNKIKKQMPDVIDMGEAGKWRKDNMPGLKCWWTKRGKSNILEILPEEAKGEDFILSPNFDNAVEEGLGSTPTIDDFNLLFDICELILIEGDNGLLLKNGDKHLYFPNGTYWTSSFEENETIIPEYIKPYSIQINSNFKKEDLQIKENLYNGRCTTPLSIRPIIKSIKWKSTI